MTRAFNSLTRFIVSLIALTWFGASLLSLLVMALSPETGQTMFVAVERYIWPPMQLSVAIFLGSRFANRGPWKG